MIMMQTSDTSNMIVDNQEEIVVNTLTNNWAVEGEQRQVRRAVLPPIRHKISSVVDRFPVIPPIAANSEQSRSSGGSSNIDHQRVEEHDSGGSRGSPRDRDTKSRNRHLLKVYLVSMCQLLIVLSLVVCFTGIKIIKDVHQQNPWIGVLSIGSTNDNFYIFNDHFSLHDDVSIHLGCHHHLLPLDQRETKVQLHHSLTLHSL